VVRTSHSVVAWLPGGRAFYYRRRLAEGGQGRFSPRLYLHRIGTEPDRDVLVFGQDLPLGAYPAPAVSRDGRWLLVGVDWGPLRGDIYVADLRAGGIEAPRFSAVQADPGVFSAGTVSRDGRLYVLTNAGAPNRRLCVAAADHPDPGGWQTLLPEDDEAVLRDVAVLDGAQLDRPLLLALRSRHALSELALHDLATGDLVGLVPAPGPGTVTELREHSDGGPCAWFSYTDFRTPPGVYRFDARTRTVTAWASSPGDLVRLRHVRAHENPGIRPVPPPGSRRAASTRSRACAGAGRRARPGAGPA